MKIYHSCALVLLLEYAATNQNVRSRRHGTLAIFLTSQQACHFWARANDVWKDKLHTVDYGFRQKCQLHLLIPLVIGDTLKMKRTLGVALSYQTMAD